MNFDAGNIAVGKDIRDLLGMRSRSALFLVACFTVTYSISAAYGTSGVRSSWPLAVAVLVGSAAAFSIVLTDGDPMPLHQSILLSATGLVACGAVFMVLPVPVHNPAQLWPFGMCTVVFTFMCVRGRTGYAWLGVILLIASSVAWATVTGQGTVVRLRRVFRQRRTSSNVDGLRTYDSATSQDDLRTTPSVYRTHRRRSSHVGSHRRKRRPTRQTQHTGPASARADCFRRANGFHREIGM